MTEVAANERTIVVIAGGGPQAEGNARKLVGFGRVHRRDVSYFDAEQDAGDVPVYVGLRPRRRADRDAPGPVAQSSEVRE